MAYLPRPVTGHKKLRNLREIYSVALPRFSSQTSRIYSTRANSQRHSVLQPQILHRRPWDRNLAYEIASRHPSSYLRPGLGKNYNILGCDAVQFGDYHTLSVGWKNEVVFLSQMFVQSSPVTGLEWPKELQEVKVPRLHDNGTGWW